MKAHPFSLKNLTATAFLCGLLQLQSSHAQDSWSGFQNGGRFTVSNLPETWDAQSKNVTWKIDIQGYGQSTPVVLGDQVFVTSTSGKNKDEYHLIAYALADGSKRWQHDFKNPSPEENNNYVSRAAPSPAVDAQGVVASFEGGVVASFSHDGKLRWSKNLIEQYGPIKARHGLASSLEQDKQ
ncbi:MAG: PQQ-binding-like beta-propeller repeat protein, partial [Planctomycetota bacterium]